MDVNEPEPAPADEGRKGDKKRKEKKSKKHQAEADEQTQRDRETTVVLPERTKRKGKGKGTGGVSCCRLADIPRDTEATQDSAAELPTDPEFPFFTQAISLYVPLLSNRFDKPPLPTLACLSRALS